MKKVKLLSYLVILLSGFMFLQCTSDKIIYSSGFDGVDGVDGADGVDGVDGVGAAACINCHSVSHREAIDGSYAMSGHFNETTIPWAGNVGLSAYTNRGGGSGSLYGDCAGCHSNEGYIDYVETGAIKIAEYETPSVVSCTTCHSNHSTFDFENDGADYALRTIEPVTLIIDNTTVIDYGGTSNSCVICHQPRKTSPVDDGTGNFIVPPHYGPHYGAQTTMLEGIEGAEIAGSVPYPTASSSTHRTGASCVSCHMGEANSDDGQHTFSPTLTSCTTCHSSATDFDYNGVQTEVETLMAELELLLVDNGILEVSPYGGVDLVTGVHPVGIANAYWNWEYVYQDHSHGIHNPAYTVALLRNSIESLQAD